MMTGQLLTLEGLRKARGLSRAEVAKRLDLSERHVYRLERGLSPLKVRYAAVLAVLYDVPLEVVLGAEVG